MSKVNNLFRPAEYFKPDTIEEAVKLMAQYGDKCSPIAGGTDVMATKNPITEALIDITALDLNYIKVDSQGLKIGATTSLTDIEISPLLSKGPYHIIAEAAGIVGTPLIRNIGTVGGNLCNAGPSADTPPALMALGAEVKLVSTGKSRVVSLDEFFTGPFRTIKEPGELLVEIIVPPLLPRTGASFHWLTKITIVDETLVGVAVAIVLNGKGQLIEDARIALNSVAPTPMRAKKAEAALRGKEVTDGLI